MSEDEDRRVFAQIRPYCVTLSQLAIAPADVFDPNSTKVSDALRDVYTHFQDALKDDTVLSPGLADYVFLPLSYLLKHPKLGDTQTTYLLRIMGLLIRHCWSSLNSFPYVLAKQLFPLVTFLTGGAPNPKDHSEINAKSEELKQAGSKALEYFFKSLAKQKQGKLYDFFSNVENLPALGHSVTVLLEFAHNGKSIELQTQALETLQTLYFDLIHDGEIISYILPGNVSTLTKIISAPGSKTHYTVIVKALYLLKTLFDIVYNDTELQVNPKEIQELEEIVGSPEINQITITEDGFTKVHRTNSWLKATSAQVKLALTNIKKVHSHSRLEVRQALADLASTVISHSLLSLNSSVPVAVEMLALLSNDKAVIVQEGLLEPPSSQQKDIINKVITRELDTYVNNLNTVIHSPNEDKIISTISAIKFAAQKSTDTFLLNKVAKSCVLELSEALRKSQQKSKIISTTTEMDELMLISEDAATLTIDPKALTVFDKIMTPQVQSHLSMLFQSLAETRDPSETIEELLSGDYQTLNEKAVVLWISNNLMQGYVSKVDPQLIGADFLTFDDDEEDNLVLLQKPEFVYSVLDYSKNILDEVAEMDPTEAVVQANSIALDTIGVVQHLLKEEFRQELIDYLYPVIDSMASPSEVVRQHALNTSLIIADQLYAGSLNRMILENSDYLIDAISVRLSNAMTTRATAILAVCTKISGYEIIETFHDLMEILFSLIDNYHGYEDLCIGFFLLFEIIADEIKKKYMYDSGMKKLQSFESVSTYSPWGLKNIHQLAALLDKKNRDIKHLTEEPLEDGVEDEINKPDSDDEDEAEAMEKMPDVKKPWPSPVPEEAYKLLQQIMYYGERLLTHPSTKLRIQILRTYKKMVPILATAPDNLLPIVASIWPVVSSLVNSSDPKVVLPASEVLELVIVHSGTFVAKRFMDFWTTLKTNRLLVSATKLTSSQNKVVLPGLEQKCYTSIVSMLVSGLNIMGRMIPDKATEDIVRCCIGVVTPETFQQHADMAWFVKREIYGDDAVGGCKPASDKTYDAGGKTYRLAV